MYAVQVLNPDTGNIAMNLGLLPARSSSGSNPSTRKSTANTAAERTIPAPMSAPTAEQTSRTNPFQENERNQGKAGHRRCYLRRECSRVAGGAADFALSEAGIRQAEGGGLIQGGRFEFGRIDTITLRHLNSSNHRPLES